ncbi:MAG: Ger(x)C family spore germination protein [Clostridia bacterium]|nr:Ger(x)C family spore germination protein [Clostridia bacterium]
MKLRLFLCLLFIASLMLSGCEYSHEITDMAYVVALGLDKAEDGVRVSFQFARPLSIGGGEQQGGGASSEGGEDEGAAKNKNTTVLSISADSFYTARAIAENSLSKAINLSHTKLLLFSEELAKEGISEHIRLFMKSSQFSPNTYVAVSLCPAEEYMKTAAPSLEINPAKYYTLIFAQQNSDYMPEATLRDVYFDLSAPGSEPVLPVTNLVQEKEGESKEAERGDYEAGEVDKGGENKTDVSGMATISMGKLSAVLSSADSVSYHLLSGKLKEHYLSIPSPSEEGKHITLRLTQDAMPKHRVEEKEQKLSISSKLFLSAELVECPKKDIDALGTDGIKTLAEGHLKEQMREFMKATQQECRADVIGFGRIFKMKFPDYPAWEAYHWQEKYQTADFSPEVTLRISREGLILEG